MYYEDLSSYEYFNGVTFPNIINIGWIDLEHGVNIGPIPSNALEKLKDIVAERGKFRGIVNVMRGIHSCPKCGASGLYSEKNGKKTLLGNSEIWVPWDGKIYVAPNLIIHYIKDHNYLPPEEFIQALVSLDTEKPFDGQSLYDELAEKFYNATPDHKETQDISR